MKIKSIINCICFQFTWKHIIEIFVKVFAAFGFLKALFELSDCFLTNTFLYRYINSAKTFITNNILFVAVVLIVILFIFFKRKLSFSWKVDGTNLTIEIALCNLFEQNGLKVIHVTDTFDTDYTIQNLIDQKTLHGQFLIKHCNKILEINNQIEDDLNGCKRTINDKLPANKYAYDIGTVAKINIDKDSYALAAYSKMQPNKRAEMPHNKEEYNNFLINMWTNLSKKTDTNTIVNIVVFGEGLNRMPATFTKQKKIHEIIHSFITSSLYGVSYKKLRICLQSTKKENREIFEKLRYLQYLFDFIDVSNSTNPKGTVIRV